MAKKIVELDGDTGRTEIKLVRQVREVDWRVTVVDNRRKRIARSLWG